MIEMLVGASIMLIGVIVGFAMGLGSRKDTEQ